MGNFSKTFRLQYWVFYVDYKQSPHHFLQERGYTSLRAMTPRGRTKGRASEEWFLPLGPDWQLSGEAPWSSSIASAPLAPPQAPSASHLAVEEAPLSCCSASLCTSSCTLITIRDSSSILRCCSKSGRTTGRRKSISSVSCPAGTFGSPCMKDEN